MRNQHQEKDFFLIAKKLTKQQQSNNDLESQLNQRYQKQSQEALKMINAYRKVQNVKPNQNMQSINKKEQKNVPQRNHQPKSGYANKIKQTLRELNANKAKQYEKLSQKKSQISSAKNINSLQVSNQMGIKAKSENQKKLIIKSAQKMWNLFLIITKRLQKQSFKSVFKSSEDNLLQDYNMAKKYRTFRLFSLWKQQTKILKIQNERKRKELSQKQIQGEQLAHQFFIFKTCKKVIKNWSRVTMNQKKKRKYEQQMAKIETQNKRNKNKQQPKPEVVHMSNENQPLQNKLRGFLDGLKQKIQHKDKKPKLQSIQQKEDQSQRQSTIFQQSQNLQILNVQESHQNQQINNLQELQHEENQPLSSQPQKPLSNQQLQKKRQQIYERSKNRKQALQKLKKQKQVQKKKEQQERKQLQRKIEEQEKRVKQLKYKEYQERKRLQKEWQMRQAELGIKAQEWNKIRILKYYGFDSWKNIRATNMAKADKLCQVLQKTMLKHAGQEFFQNLQEDLNQVLSKLYSKMDFIYNKNLKRKSLKGFKIQKALCIQQKIQLQAFHQVHMQKIFLSQWKQIMDVLRLENLQQQRPLIKKANDYHKVSLMLKSLRQLKKNAVQSKKEKNIQDQKLKIKSKIKDIMKEKIEINFQEFL